MAESDRLLSDCTPLKVYRGFKSRSLRHNNTDEGLDMVLTGFTRHAPGVRRIPDKSRSLSASLIEFSAARLPGRQL